MSCSRDADPALDMVPLAPLLGAEIRGVDLSCDIAASLVRAIKDAWREHGVLLFRGQCIDDEAHVRFARRFGELERFAHDGQHPERPPEIFHAANTDEDGRLLPPGHEHTRLLKINWLWHTDGSYREIPVAGAVLRAVRVADSGGETVFANLRAAYDALPDARRHRLDTARVRHSFKYLVQQHDLPELADDELTRLPHAVHPLVRVHADGRRSLFLSPPYMESVLGWDEAEARCMIETLTQWATQEHFLYVHHWREGDVVMWDNGWTMHKVMPYPIDRTPRVVHGSTILTSTLAG